MAAFVNHQVGTVDKQEPAPIARRIGEEQRVEGQPRPSRGFAHRLPLFLNQRKVHASRVLLFSWAAHGTEVTGNGDFRNEWVRPYCEPTSTVSPAAWPCPTAAPTCALQIPAGISGLFPLWRRP